MSSDVPVWSGHRQGPTLAVQAVPRPDPAPMLPGLRPWRLGFRANDSKSVYQGEAEAVQIHIRGRCTDGERVEAGRAEAVSVQ